MELGEYHVFQWTVFETLYWCEHQGNTLSGYPQNRGPSVMPLPPVLIILAVIALVLHLVFSYFVNQPLWWLALASGDCAHHHRAGADFLVCAAAPGGLKKRLRYMTRIRNRSP
jgi:hypothetical protein